MATIEELLHRRTDLSTFLVHLTRDGEYPARTNLLRMLCTREIEAQQVYGMASELAKKSERIAKTQRVVCFTETPLEHTWMMCQDIDKRGCQFEGYGLAFTKTYAREQAANPVWYLDITPRSGPLWLTGAVEDLLEQAKDAAREHSDDPEKCYSHIAGSPVLRLTPFIEQMGPTRRGRKEFWWEREWRHVGNFQFWERSNLVVAFVPEQEQEDFRSELLDLCREHRLIADDHYDDLALLDPTWGLERMVATLAGVQNPGPFPG